MLTGYIFIRVAEDRKVEPPTLIPLLHQWKSGGQVGRASPYQAMIEKFRELDKIYNSNLFSEHPFEKWEEYSGNTEKVINILYGDKIILSMIFLPFRPMFWARFMKIIWAIGWNKLKEII